MVDTGQPDQISTGNRNDSAGFCNKLGTCDTDANRVPQLNGAEFSLNPSLLKTHPRSWRIEFRLSGFTTIVEEIPPL